jgi:hypothetical protein
MSFYYISFGHLSSAPVSCSGDTGSNPGPETGYTDLGVSLLWYVRLDIFRTSVSIKGTTVS